MLETNWTNKANLTNRINRSEADAKKHEMGNEMASGVEPRTEFEGRMIRVMIMRRGMVWVG